MTTRHHPVGPRSSGPAPDTADIEALLTGYAGRTGIPGSTELVARIQQRIALEPQTPLRRLGASITGLRPRDAVSAFRQIVVTASGGRHVRPALQAQALGVLLVLVVSLGVVGTGAGIGIGSWLRGMHDGPVAPPTYAGGSPSVATDPSPEPTLGLVGASPQATSSAAPAEQPRDSATAKPDRTSDPRPATGTQPAQRDRAEPRPTRSRDRDSRPRPARTEAPDATRDEEDDEDDEDEEDDDRGRRGGEDEDDEDSDEGPDDD